MSLFLFLLHTSMICRATVSFVQKELDKVITELAAMQEKHDTNEFQVAYLHGNVTALSRALKYELDLDAIPDSLQSA